MKKFLLIATSIIAKISINAQVIMLGKYDSSIKINYIRTWEPVKPYTSDADVISQSRTTGEVRQSTAYFDGLGRPLQTVLRRGSLATGDTARDMVAPLVYDAFGRETYKYLPFAANGNGSNTSISDGKFKLNPFQQDSAFNKGIFSDETYYYAKTVFETSPLNRILESFAPGNNWVGSAAENNESNRHGIKTKNWINEATDSVRLWNVTNVSNSFGTYATSSIYAGGLLFKNIIQDEHNKQVIEFKDKGGNVLLKKVQYTAEADTGLGKNHSGWLCTYYIYDDLNQLRAVIQPKAVDVLAANGWSLNDTLLNELCFRYEYDSKGRIIMKKVPGSGIVNMVYDARDRLVLTQDSVMRANNKWFYTIYDALNRPSITGLWSNNNTRAYHADRADTSIAYPNLDGQTIEELTKNFYDDYNWRSGEGNPLSATREDDYDSYLLTANNSSWPYPQDATAQSNQLRGMITGSKIKVLGTSNTYLYTVSFYDDKARIIQMQSTNYSTGTDIALTQYAWNGTALFTIYKHQKAVTNSQAAIVLTKFTYDDLYRLIKTEKKISHTKVNSGSMPSSWTVINENEYDALGQLKKKKLGDIPLDSLQYDYNIRGWMLGMNRSYVKDTTATDHWFGFDLGYDKTSFTVNGGSQSYSATQFNGNINGTLWRAAGDGMLRKYDFTYDAVNRLLTADFNQLNSNSFSKAAGIDFSLSGMSYDANGNILTMNQKGLKVLTSSTIDSLAYGYNTHSNKLNYVYDRANDANSKLGDFKEQTNNTSQDYGYDGNGNLINDANKKITLIHYNHLNLPDSIRINGKGIIKYTYDAAGNKIKKVTIDSTGSTVKTITTLYLIGNYVNDTLQYLATEEGRARITDDNSLIVYDYFIKDHLGNIRTLLTEEVKVDAYPPASMETAQATVENTYYRMIEETRHSLPGEYPTDTYTDPNDYVAMVRSYFEDWDIGPNMLLKVMSGDRINLRVSSWWEADKYTTPGSPNNALYNLIYQMAAGVAGQTDKFGTNWNIVDNSLLNSGVSEFLGTQSGYNSSKPKAFVNWILLDDQFKLVASSSGFEQVGASGDFTVHTHNDLYMYKNGYLFVYVSNETPNIPVYFDNLQVTHYRGPLVEENSYYPFGLTMNGTSSKALNFGNPQNRKGYNGNELQSKEFNDGSGLEVYDFNARTYDPEIGRFLQIDPQIENGNQESFNPYHFGFDNPILYNDPTGKLPPVVWWLLRRLAWEGGKYALREGIKNIRVGYRAYKESRTLFEHYQGLKVFQVLAQAQQELKGLEDKQQQIEKSIESHKQNIEEHKKKIEDFEKDPVGNSGEKWLKEATKDNPSKQELLKRAEGRIEALKKQLKKQEGELKKEEQKLEQTKKEIEEIKNPSLNRRSN